jgi:hypothetical protein
MALRRQCKMLGLLIFAVTVLLAFADAGTVRLFRRRRASRGWWCALAVAWSVGAGMGFQTPKLREGPRRPTQTPTDWRQLEYPSPKGGKRWVSGNPLEAD